MSTENAIPPTPFMAARQGFGAGETARVVPYKLDGTRCGMVQGRHAAWNWAYRVVAPDGRMFDMGRGLTHAREFAAQLAEYVRDEKSGALYRRGPNGGLSRVTTPPAASAAKEA